jgi:hypothetical protein
MTSPEASEVLKSIESDRQGTLVVVSWTVAKHFISNTVAFSGWYLCNDVSYFYYFFDGDEEGENWKQFL